MKKIEIIDGITTGREFAKNINDNFIEFSGFTTAIEELDKITPVSPPTVNKKIKPKPISEFTR